MLRKLALVLILEILVGINAGLSFNFFERFTAALWAGSCFLALGVFILTYLFHWNFKTKSLLFWVAIVHTFVFSVPLLVARAITPAEQNVPQVLMIPMVHFHKASTVNYAVMIGATLLAMALEIVRMRKKNPKI
jgi:hypothetical protein